MIHVSTLSAPSCSGSSGIGTRKRRNDSETENSGLKIPKGNFYFVLQSESDISSSEGDSESVISLQNKSTDFCRDTSDTGTKTSRSSDIEVEYELVSLSENDDPNQHPFNSYSSGTDSEMLVTKHSDSEVSGGSISEKSAWADSSSGPEDSPTRVPAKIRPCLKCSAPTGFAHFCCKCYKVRKDFFPPRPKRYRRKHLKSYFKKKCSKEVPKLPLKDEKAESGIESASSQEISLTPDESPNDSVGSEGLCNVCLKNPKNGAFVHCRWVHIYSCYQCSVKIWFTSKCCPLCNGKINKVCKVGMG